MQANRDFWTLLLPAVVLLLFLHRAPVHAAEPHPALSEAQIQQLDEDRDGRLSREEARRHRGLVEVFTRLDTDRDGYLSGAEISGSGGGRLGG